MLSYDQYGYAAVAALGTLIAVLAVHWLMGRSPFSAWTRSLSGVVAPFINVIGVLFALTLAFLANDTWTAHDRAMGAVLQEADAIHSLQVLSEMQAPADRERLQAAIADYAAAVVAEWPLLARRSTDPAVGRSGDRLLSLAAGLAGGATQQVMLQQVTALKASRDLRIGLSQTHVNPLKWLGMAFLGLLTLVSVAVVHADHPRAALVGTVLFALAAAPTSVIVLVHGNPFQPPSAVSPAAIAEGLRPQ
ncbi:MAG TPA: DUF4239 domain-containing protein [Rhodospirillaceae bacterium]|nr:DUF4239 domain-containing protein [Rhodospirillaceae bacterium]